jgi:hypothetical protein
MQTLVQVLEAVVEVEAVVGSMSVMGIFHQLSEVPRYHCRGRCPDGRWVYKSKNELVGTCEHNRAFYLGFLLVLE